MTPTPYPPTPKWSSRVGEMSNEEEEEDDPHPLPTPPQMVLTVKNFRWVIICVFHAHPPCTHYTAVPAYWDPEGSASLSRRYINILFKQIRCALSKYKGCSDASDGWLYSLWFFMDCNGLSPIIGVKVHFLRYSGLVNHAAIDENHIHRVTVESLGW